ncbi:DNA mismatch repair protein MutS [Erysipelothrix sp. HDW6C]|uniref:DNA mismatch repair protein MutS n=1 Tax=Erysipelothrix sp. HDW6C TaxID=2714930 RepID=UPI00140DFE12|nr:DNA mismatch repair protein MutS [Erysipelothrix sp. HDW6C]QIK69097.1 DNA mismatch repair protein MutS [Erysipelothrix sp. HDW6C]
MKHSNLTPMLQQYMDIKENTNDALVFYRLGDFYELFFEDAITASKVLDLVLTARSAGGNEKAPMCGVPHHAAANYIQKLVASGYKVAIVEQVENPKEVKGIVRREVVEIVTPGTYFEMDDNETREIAAIHSDLVYATVVSCNIVSGEVRAIRVMNDFVEIIKVLQQFQVKEIVLAEDFNQSIIAEISGKTDIYISYENDVDPTIKHSDNAIQNALGRLNQYLIYTHKRSLDHLSEVVVLNDLSYLRMDYATMTNLELIDHQKGKELSLYHFLNRTRTNMGSRALKQYLMQPLVNLEDIKIRHSQIDTLIDDYILNDRLVDLLKETYDVHRVVARLSTGKHNAQDLVRLKKTLAVLIDIKAELTTFDEFQFIAAIDGLQPVLETLSKTICDDAPVALKEGRTFQSGVDDELDELLVLSKNGKQWLIEYEAAQRERTGIKNLKVGYTRAFGYYIEISKGQIENVRDDFGYIRKQTLTAAERYISEELQNYEVKISQASDRILEIESRLFDQYSEFVNGYSKQIHHIGDAIANLDVLVALAEVSSLPGYTKPHFVDGKVLDIRNGKHPVLETTLKDHQYIASDAILDADDYTLILTGPNMGGKSTFMRMVALNAIMAQVGCYVPCESLTMSIVDQIFTRMGASDDILMGQSTFMVEMMEAQAALSKATAHSLILFDEIGRGTSTYDGMALAQAIIEYINNSIKARTIFSTHYHELVTLEEMYSGIRNVHVEVHEENDHVTFLYRVIDGRADKSYGINVARLAHLPQSIIDRAKQNLALLELSKDSVNIDAKVVQIEVEPQGYATIKHKLQSVDVNQLTPLEALMFVSDLKKALGDDSHE